MVFFLTVDFFLACGARALAAAAAEAVTEKDRSWIVELEVLALANDVC